MPRRITIPSRLSHSPKYSFNTSSLSRRQFASSQTPTPESTVRDDDVTSTTAKPLAESDTSSHQSKQSLTEKQKKTMAQLDEELRQKMSGMASDGGEAGIEYEDGKPVAMKRSVKNNMFRYI
ncbi:hypothetical protein HD806DRAFT_490515 [Xylariaceae sp. AK1471]|nr:hypothetical protein HD806DRAFT_490515 [Xylariaceae sp. AK1471]